MMSPKDIRRELFERDLTVSGLARKFTQTGTPCRREELSMTIRQVRVYPALRERLSEELGISIERLFGRRVSKAA